MWKKYKDLIASVSHVATAASVVFGVIFAYLQITSAREAHEEMLELERALSASGSYKTYLAAWLDNPGLNCYQDRDDVPNKIRESKYEAFVATMATAAEKIILAMPEDQEWRNTVKYAVRRHLPFFSDEELNIYHYSERFDQLILEVRNETGGGWTEDMCT